jgi:hypothetical protein
MIAPNLKDFLHENDFTQQNVHDDGTGNRTHYYTSPAYPAQTVVILEYADDAGFEVFVQVHPGLNVNRTIDALDDYISGPA